MVISDTAEYGCYLFSNKAVPLLSDFMKSIDTDVIGRGLDLQDSAVDNLDLIDVNEAIRYTDVEAIGAELRAFMGAMKQL